MRTKLLYCVILINIFVLSFNCFSLKASPVDTVWVKLKTNYIVKYSYSRLHLPQWDSISIKSHDFGTMVKNWSGKHILVFYDEHVEPLMIREFSDILNQQNIKSYEFLEATPTKNLSSKEKLTILMINNNIWGWYLNSEPIEFRLEYVSELEKVLFNLISGLEIDLVIKLSPNLDISIIKNAFATLEQSNHFSFEIEDFNTQEQQFIQSIKH